MLTRIKSGEIVDPVNGRLGKGDLWIRDGEIVEAPRSGRADRTFDASGCVVMAGAIDIHSHIGGGNVNTARLLLPEEHKAHQARPAATPLSNAGWSTFETGCLYAKMGFTTVVEPAMSPNAALHTHLELADIPIIDKATLAILGNDDFLLSMIRDDASPRMIEDYVAWTVASTRALGVKVINAGPRLPSRRMCGPFRSTTSCRLTASVREKSSRRCRRRWIGRFRIRCMSTATISARRVRPTRQRRRSLQRACRCICTSPVLWLWHRGKRKFSSAAARLAELVNASPEVTIDTARSCSARPSPYRLMSCASSPHVAQRIRKIRHP